MLVKTICLECLVRDNQPSISSHPVTMPSVKCGLVSTDIINRSQLLYKIEGYFTNLQWLKKFQMRCIEPVLLYSCEQQGRHRKKNRVANNSDNPSFASWMTFFMTYTELTFFSSLKSTLAYNLAVKTHYHRLLDTYAVYNSLS